jgi:hypothetical protein
MISPHPTPPPQLLSPHTTTTEGAKAEAAYAKDGSLPDPESTTNPEFKIVLGLIRDGLAADPTKYTRMAKRCQVSAHAFSHALRAQQHTHPNTTRCLSAFRAATATANDVVGCGMEKWVDY